MIRNGLSALIFLCCTFTTATVNAHFFGHFGSSETDYDCKPHHHGRFRHRCTDEQHASMDVSHSHPGLQEYYARQPDFYFGAKAGAFSVKNRSFEADGVPMAFLAGYGTYDFSVELELSRGSVNPVDQFDFTPSSRKIGRYDTLALYGVHKFGGQLYAKAKIGLRKNWATTDSGTNTSENISLGFGIGKNLGRFTLEGEWTVLETDVQFSSFGLNYKF